MLVPIIIHKDADSDYGVTVPDLPGCFSAGSSLKEAYNNAKEAITGHLGVLLEHGEAIPQPSEIEAISQLEQAEDAHSLNYIDMDDNLFTRESQQVTITLPKYYISAFDQYADKKGMKRSNLLLKGAMEYMGNHP